MLTCPCGGDGDLVRDELGHIDHVWKGCGCDGKTPHASPAEVEACCKRTRDTTHPVLRGRMTVESATRFRIDREGEEGAAVVVSSKRCADGSYETTFETDDAELKAKLMRGGRALLRIMRTNHSGELVPVRCMFDQSEQHEDIDGCRYCSYGYDRGAFGHLAPGLAEHAKKRPRCTWKECPCGGRAALYREGGGPLTHYWLECRCEGKKHYSVEEVIECSSRRRGETTLRKFSRLALG